MTKKAILLSLAVACTGNAVQAGITLKNTWDTAGDLAQTFGTDDIMRFAQILSLDSTNTDIIRMVNTLSAGAKTIKLADALLQIKKTMTSRQVEAADGQPAHELTESSYDLINTDLTPSQKGGNAARISALVDTATIWNDIAMVKNANWLARNNKNRPAISPLEIEEGMLEGKVGIVGKSVLFAEGLAAMGLNFWANKCKEGELKKGAILTAAYLIKGIQRFQIWNKQNKRLKEVKEQMAKEGVTN